MTEPFIGEIKMVGFNFAPRGYAFCNGQLISISQNTALFSLLGTTYGGNGTTNFALPDLRGRVPIHFGQGSGLSVYSLGQASGTETTTLLTTNLPAHNHSSRLRAESNVGTTANPTDAMISVSIQGDRIFGPDTTAAEVNMNIKAISEQTVGSNVPFSNLQPYLVVNFVIATQGIFPSRN
jgi:microcystin-dependent protein